MVASFVKNFLSLSFFSKKKSSVINSFVESWFTFNSSKRFFSGYYPNIDSDGVCSGNPWKIKMDNTEKIEDKDFADKIQFEIKLQMIK